MRILGLTGGIGSGKSTVAAIFAQLGADVVDADRLAREIVEPGQPALQEIAQAFGRDVLLPDGRLNRGKLAARVFADPSDRARLNAITHPRIHARMRQEVQARRDRPGLLILDIPLLFENSRMEEIEAVILVWVDGLTQEHRLIERDGLTAVAARDRIAAQMPLDQKRALAEHIIDNRGTPAETRGQVEALVRLYRGAS